MKTREIEFFYFFIDFFKKIYQFVHSAVSDIVNKEGVQL